jgi:hypothetical protein
MTYFGAAEDFADSVESEMATRNSCPSFHKNVPRGALCAMFHVEHYVIFCSRGKKGVVGGVGGKTIRLGFE